MKFIDNEHKLFYEQKLKEIEKADAYSKATIYALAMCPVTRENFNDIFDLKNREINIKSINAAYQTDTSKKVTRLAFNLWNDCNYDSEEDIENNKVSTNYNISEIFNCSYGPYFYEAIKLRYPEYVIADDTVANTIDNVIKRIRNKYSQVINIILCENEMTLEYLYTINEEKDCFQLMKIKKFDDRLSVKFIPQNINKIVNIQGLEDIFEMQHKQSTNKNHTAEEIKAIKEKYQVGTQIRLIKMYDLQPIDAGTIGTVTAVNDIGQIHMNLENGSTLELNVDIDEFEILNKEMEQI